MLALRYAALLALTVWVGGLVALGSIVAPTIFEVLGRFGINDTVSGAVFGRVLDRAHTAGYVCGVVLLITLIARRILGPRPIHVGVRVIVAAIMLAAMLYSGMVISQEINALRQSAGNVPMAALADDDPRRVDFKRLHATSTALVFVPILGGLLLLYFELKD